MRLNIHTHNLLLLINFAQKPPSKKSRFSDSEMEEIVRDNYKVQMHKTPGKQNKHTVISNSHLRYHTDMHVI